MTLPKALTAAIGSAAALAMLPAMAASKDDVTKKTIDVSISGYDLSDPEHAKIVYGKIQSAAKRVCRLPNAAKTLAQRADEMQCRVSAINAAVSQIGSPELTIVMEARSRAS
ncbi:MAG: UrcA family protein [Pseudomonadota bacterium]